jgi:hypothetical protein
MTNIAYAECHYAESPGLNYRDAWYRELCNYTDCRYADCRYIDCPGILSSLKEMVLRKVLKDSLHVRRKLSNFSAESVYLFIFKFVPIFSKFF